MPPISSRTGRLCIRFQARRVLVLSVVVSILLHVFASDPARAYVDRGVETDLNGGAVLEIAPGGSVSYRVRPAATQPDNATIPAGKTWWIIIRADGARRDFMEYKGLGWTPSVGWEFTELGGDWRTVSIRAADDAVVGTTVTIAHEIWDHEKSCPVHDAAPFTVRIVASTGNERNGGNNNGNDVDSNGNVVNNNGNDANIDGNDNGNDGNNNGFGGNGGNGGNSGNGGNAGDGDTDGNTSRFIGQRSTLLRSRAASAMARRAEPPPPPGTRDWLRGLGGAAAVHVMDAVDERIRCAVFRHPRGGESVNLPGRWRCGPRFQRRASLVIAGHLVSDPDLGFLTARADAMAGTPAPPDMEDDWRGNHAPSTTWGTEQDLVSGSAFHLSTGTKNGGPGVSVWGRGSVSRVDTGESTANVNATVGTATLGADYAADRLLLGLAVSYSDGDGTISGTGPEHDMESSLTGLYPYIHIGVTERLTVWGSVGAGSGTMTLTNEEDAEPLETRIALKALATGSRTELRSPSAPGGIALALKSDALLLRVDSRESSGIAGVDAESTRLRLSLEGSSEIIVAESAPLSPFLEAGVRHDSGDEQSGAGVELGAGVRFAAPEIGLTAEVGARGLVAHAIDGYREWGVSGSVRFDPYPGSDRGASFTLGSSVGPISERSVDSLWRREMSADSLSDGGGEFERSLDAEVGYGFPIHGGTATGTPWLGVSVSERRRGIRLGYRVRLSPSVVAGVDTSFERDMDGGASPRHAIMFRLSIR